jgi:hypothetical protein
MSRCRYWVWPSRCPTLHGACPAGPVEGLLGRRSAYLPVGQPWTAISNDAVSRKLCQLVLAPRLRVWPICCSSASRVQHEKRWDTSIAAATTSLKSIGRGGSSNAVAVPRISKGADTLEMRWALRSHIHAQRRILFRLWRAGKI